MGKRGSSAEIEGVRRLANRGLAPAARGDGPAGRAPRFSKRPSYARVGRTIGEAREHLETANERAAARKKDKQKTAARITSVSLVFLIVIAILIIVAVNFIGGKKEEPAVPATDTTSANTPTIPTVEIIDEDASATGGNITGRMREYIALAEADFKDLGYQPTRAVIPANSVREVDFYLDGHPGRIKMTIDRDSAISTEDADRMLRYLASQGITEFEYIDVRLDGKAYWK